MDARRPVCQPCNRRNDQRQPDFYSIQGMKDEVANLHGHGQRERWRLKFERGLHEADGEDKSDPEEGEDEDPIPYAR